MQPVFSAAMKRAVGPNSNTGLCLTVECTARNALPGKPFLNIRGAIVSLFPVHVKELLNNNPEISYCFAVPVSPAVREMRIGRSSAAGLIVRTVPDVLLLRTTIKVSDSQSAKSSVIITRSTE